MLMVRKVVKEKVAMVREIVKGELAARSTAGTILDKSIVTYWVLYIDETIGCKGYWWRTEGYW
jgi:hypothetical protein